MTDPQSTFPPSIPAGRSRESALPKFDRGVSVLAWAYNEEVLIEGFLRRLIALMEATVEDYEIILVDDGSTDGTGPIAQRLRAEYPRLVVLTNETNRNTAHSFKRARLAATKEFVFWQTVDWSYDISNLRVFLELLRGYDVVVGTRRLPAQSGKRWLAPFFFIYRNFNVRYLPRRSDNAWKGFISMINYSLIRGLFRVPLSDYQNVMFFPTGLIRDMAIEAKSSFAGPEMLFKTYWMGKSLVEVPIPFIPRSAGQAKGTKVASLYASVKDIFKFWYLWVWRGKRNRKTTGSVRRLDIQEWRSAFSAGPRAHGKPAGGGAGLGPVREEISPGRD